MKRMLAEIDPHDIRAYENWGIAEILYSFLVDDYDVYEENPEHRRMQLKAAILKSEEFEVVRNGGRVVGGYARPNLYRGEAV